MGTRMLLFPGEEHLHRAPSWGGMHDPDVGNSPSWMGPCYSPTSTSTSGGNTWSKRLAASGTHNDSDSWEVRAFAEDASTSGQWPPRSYSCSFCQREFRTAQALGGHMNVHRRERAQANQLAQLRTTGTDAHNNGSSHDDNNNNRNPNHNPNDNSHHWLTRSNSQDIPAGDGPYNSRAYAPARSVVDDESYPASSYGGPSSYRNGYSSSYESAWRSPYDTPRDSGLDLELRLGQRYD